MSVKVELIYKNPHDFVQFMMARLVDTMDVDIELDTDDGMTMEAKFRDGVERMTISLHNVYRTYMRTGDLNAAIDFLNGVMETKRFVRNVDKDKPCFDPARIYPTLRPKYEIARQVEGGLKILYESEVPGLETVFIERKIGFTLLVGEDMLKKHPAWSPSSVKERAYDNLRKKGWRKPNLQLPSPFCDRSQVLVYLDPPVPIQCLFLLPDMTAGHLPQSFIVAFPNKDTTIVLVRDGEPPDSIAAARRQVRETRFLALAEQSYAVQPYPLSKNLYWMKDGLARRI